MQQSICSGKPNPDILKKINDVSIEFGFDFGDWDVF